MKKPLLFITLSFLFCFSLSAQTTQEQANAIVLQYIQNEMSPPFLLYGYVFEPSEEPIILATTKGEVIEIEYACWAYYVNEHPNLSTPCQHRYLFVKEDDGNLLEIITTNDLGVTDFTDWVLSVIHNAALSNLSVSEGELEPAFSSNIFNYMVNVIDAEEIAITATPAHENATVSGTGTFPLEIGENSFTINIIAEDGVTELNYTIVVSNSVQPSNDATLLNLSVSEGELKPAFSSNVFNYMVNVIDAEEITIAATPAHENATVSGTGTFPLEGGLNNFTVKVIAEDGVTELNYTIAINNLLHITETENSSITIYPNPTTGELLLRLRSATDGELKIENVEVFDIYGRKLSSNHLITSSSNHLINISHLNPGMYFVKILTEQGEMVKRVVKQ